jgi:hypothetical protein
LPRFRSRGLLVAALASTSLVSAAPANAALVETAACDDAALSQPFQRWGDPANYKLLSGGDAEGALDGWSFGGGGRVGAGSNPYAATGDLGDASFVLKPGASVTTAATCVNAAYPSFRFFAKSSGGLLGLVSVLKVDLVYRDSALGLLAVPIGVVTPSSSWRPSPTMLSLSAVGAAVAGGEASLAFRFTAVGGTWTVDDVFVDPFRRS